MRESVIASRPAEAVTRRLLSTSAAPSSWLRRGSRSLLCSSWSSSPSGRPVASLSPCSSSAQSSSAESQQEPPQQLHSRRAPSLRASPSASGEPWDGIIGASRICFRASTARRAIAPPTNPHARATDRPSSAGRGWRRSDYDSPGRKPPSSLPEVGPTGARHVDVVPFSLRLPVRLTDSRAREADRPRSPSRAAPHQTVGFASWKIQASKKAVRSISDFCSASAMKSDVVTLP